MGCDVYKLPKMRACVGVKKRDTGCSLKLFPIVSKMPPALFNYGAAVQIQVDVGSSMAPSVLLYSRKSWSFQTLLCSSTSLGYVGLQLPCKNLLEFCTCVPNLSCILTAVVLVLLLFHPLTFHSSCFWCCIHHS